jgi:hypothetical protein
MLEGRGIREAATSAETDLMRSAWSEHWRYVAGRDPVTCHGCFAVIDRPYAAGADRASQCWCYDCVDGLGERTVMHAFAGVFILA